MYSSDLLTRFSTSMVYRLLVGELTDLGLGYVNMFEQIDVREHHINELFGSI